MRPAEALDIHALLTEVMGTTPAQRYITAMTRISLRVPNIDHQVLITALRNHLAVADTYHLDVRMASTVLQHGEQLREVSRIEQFEPPSACGVLTLDQPWDVEEVSGNTQHVNIITWGPVRVGRPDAQDVHTGTLFTLWWDTRRINNSFTRALQENSELQTVIDMFGGLYPIYIIPMPRDIRIGPYWHPVPEEKQVELRAQGRSIAERLNSPLHHVLATWELMAQSVANVVDEPLHRAESRRARRANIPPRVTVISLRRNEHSAETGTGTPLAWRVPVKSHTRHYWVRDPETGELVRERRDIETHWRGPQDAPVRVTDKVYTLKR